MENDRVRDLICFYALLDRLSELVPGPKILASCTGRNKSPIRGAHVFQEQGEERRESGSGHSRARACRLQEVSGEPVTPEALRR